MSRSKVWVPVLAGAAAVGALAYAFTRRGRNASPSAPSAANDAQTAPALRDSMVVERGEALGPLAELDLDGVFEGDSEELADLERAQPAYHAVRVPPLTGADDEEAPSPDDLGAFWLQRAAQSEHSASEAELIIDIDDLAIAAPGEEEDVDDGDRLSAEAWRG